MSIYAGKDNSKMLFSCAA